MDLASALRALERGAVVAAATESSFGLLADATRREAIEALLRIKPRGADEGIGLVLPTREAWRSLVRDIPPVAERLADVFWPGPLTIALVAAAGVDPRLTAGGTLAVRLPGISPAAEIARAFGRPLTATSANDPGGEPAIRGSAVERAFAAAVARGDLVVLAGDAPGGAPSTLVVIDGGELRLARAGSIAVEDIERAARAPVVAGPRPE